MYIAKTCPQQAGVDGWGELGSAVTNRIENFTYVHFLFSQRASVVISAGSLEPETHKILSRGARTQEFFNEGESFNS